MTPNLQLHMLKGQQSQEQAVGRQGIEQPLPLFFFFSSEVCDDGKGMSLFWQGPLSVHVCGFFCERE